MRIPIIIPVLCLAHHLNAQTNTPGNYYLTDTFCTNQIVLVGNQLFDASNPAGTVVLPGAAASGMDSFIHVQFYFFQPSTIYLDQNLCAGDTLLVNGTAYHRDFYIGEEVIAGGAANGCDSLIFIDLKIQQPTEITIEDTLTWPDFRIYNQQKYDFRKPSGTEILQGTNGCDSTLQIRLHFLFPDTLANLYLPNVFMPDGPSPDNYYFVGTDTTIETIEYMVVGDRWGEPIFEVRNLDPGDWTRGWDGRFRGKPAPVGVYLVRVSARQKRGGRIEKAGTITLLR